MSTRLPKLILPLMMLVALLTGLIPTAAQEGLWKAFLFNATSGELMQVNADGSQASYDLGIDNSANSFVGGGDLAVSPDGLRVAYCRLVYPADPQAAPTAALIVHDLVANQDVLTLPVSARQGCRAGEGAFSDDGTRLAVATVNGFNADPTLPAGMPLWELMVYDLNTGTVLASLGPESPLVAGLPWVGNSVLMLTERFSAEGVIFKVAAWASEGTFEDAYLWSLVECSVTVAPHWGAWGVDYLSSTREYAVSALDPNRPLGEPAGPMPLYNVVQVIAGPDTRTVFAGGVEWLLLDQVFVNDGRSLAMQMFSAFDTNDPNALSRTRWSLLERDGRLTDLYIGEWFSDLRAIPGGYLLFTQDDAPAVGSGATRFSLRLGAADAMQTIWQSPPAADYQSWELVWTTPFTPAADLLPFTAIP
jgi:hypothetical protein